jgi:hypothetical protein
MREWSAAAFSRLSPALRFGPILRDAVTTRLPVPADIRGKWFWHRRTEPAKWVSDTVVGASTMAQFSQDPPSFSDGWLQVELAPDTHYAHNQIQMRITCVQRLSKRSGKIVAVGGENEDGSKFLLPVNEAIRLLESGRFGFFVDQQGLQRVLVRVVTRKNGQKFLRTVADRKNPNNLEKLPDWVA